MKSKLVILLFVVSFLIGVTSCKKDIQSCKLGKSYISDGNNTPLPNTFSYYENGKLKSIIYSNNEHDTLYYVADTLTVTHFDYRDSVAFIVKGIVDANGNLLSASKTTFDYTGVVTDSETWTNEYNSDGRMTKQTVNNTLGTTNLVVNYSGSNSVSANFYRGVILEKKYFFYHNAVANKTGLDDFNNIFTPYLGKPSANLLDSVHMVLTATFDTVKIKYDHTLDANEYVGKTVQTYLTPGFQTKYYTYQYFGCSN